MISKNTSRLQQDIAPDIGILGKILAYMGKSGLDVRALEMGVESLMALPLFDKGEIEGVGRVLVQFITQTALFFSRGFEKAGEQGLERLRFLGFGLKKRDDADGVFHKAGDLNIGFRGYQPFDTDTPMEV